MQLAGTVYRDIVDLDAARGEWDDLAVALGRPFAAPAWAAEWWAHLHPAGGRPRLVVVRDGDSLVGVAPLISVGRSYASMGGGLAPVEILARPGFEAEVASIVAARLADEEPPPRMLELEGHVSAPDWPALLDKAWPRGSTWRWEKARVPAPLVDLGDGFEAWLGSRSKSFRREMRNKQRKLEDAGGSFRHATAASLERDVAEFLRLHRKGMESRGGSRLDADGIEPMLIGVGRQLLDTERFRLLLLELDGATIGAQLLLAAGTEVSAWSIGFDSAYAKLSPAMLCMLHSLADAAARGETTMSFGAGGQAYKYRLSNREDWLRSELLVPPGNGHVVARFRLVPQQVRHVLGRRVSPRTKDVLRRLGRRLGAIWR